MPSSAPPPLDPTGDDDLRTLLRDVRHVAVVGVSDDPSRASHEVARWLIEHTDLVVSLVNPNVEELFGRRVAAELAELPTTPDLVDVFRRSSHLPDLARQVRACEIPAMWTQLGVRDDEVAAALRADGVAVVEDRCLKVDWARLRPHD